MKVLSQLIDPSHVPRAVRDQWNGTKRVCSMFLIIVSNSLLPPSPAPASPLMLRRFGSRLFPWAQLIHHWSGSGNVWMMIFVTSLLWNNGPDGPRDDVGRTNCGGSRQQLIRTY